MLIGIPKETRDNENRVAITPDILKKIIPKSRLYIETFVKSFKRGLAICEGLGLVKNVIACKADFNLVLPEEIKKYNLKE